MTKLVEDRTLIGLYNAIGQDWWTDVLYNTYIKTKLSKLLRVSTGIISSFELFRVSNAVISSVSCRIVLTDNHKDIKVDV